MTGARPLLLDLFCCQGGAAVGYHRAGFDVIGVDIDPQPRYPFPFIQADALNPPFDLARFDAIHVSPPCQAYSTSTPDRSKHPQLIEPVRRLIIDTGLPYVIENVRGAPLRNPVTLCGTMFDELSVIRHRLFESNFPIAVPSHPAHPLVFTHDKRKAHYGLLDQNTSYVQVTGGGNATVTNKRRAMAMEWADNHGLNEAIPPAYTEYIGRQLLALLNAPTVDR